MRLSWAFGYRLLEFWKFGLLHRRPRRLDLDPRRCAAAFLAKQVRAQ